MIPYVGDNTNVHSGLVAVCPSAGILRRTERQLHTVGHQCVHLARIQLGNSSHSQGAGCKEAPPQVVQVGAGARGGAPFHFPQAPGHAPPCAGPALTAAGLR